MPDWADPALCTAAHGAGRVTLGRMNVAFFLTPKDAVVWVPSTVTLLEALAVMQPHRHSAVPILDPEEGRYLGTLTEGDALLHLQKADKPWREAAAATRVSEIDRWLKNDPIHIQDEMEMLIARVVVQSFVPVVDDRSVFVGLVLRKNVIDYCARRAGILPPL